MEKWTCQKCGQIMTGWSTKETCDCGGKTKTGGGFCPRKKTKMQTVTEKKCTKCGETKTIPEFGCHRVVKSGLRSWCKECEKKYCRAWRKENPEIFKNSYRRWKSANHDRILENNRRWQAANPGIMKVSRRKTLARRRIIPKAKLNHNIAKEMGASLKGCKAGRRWESLVGYSVDQLKRHLEKKFENGMTWDNYGTYWWIDHKIPIAVFNFNNAEDFDFKRCWSLKNLQPMEAKKNISKGAKIEKPFQPSLSMSG